MPASIAHVSPYSGSWYPDDPAELGRHLEDLWLSSEQRAGSPLLPRARAFIVPHAGLMYSGAVAAVAYRHLERHQPRRIVVMGFCHRGSPPGIFAPDIESFETPLGRLEVDRECVEELLGHSQFRRMSETRLCDHSVEIQLPLIRKAAPEARIVPLYVGHLDPGARLEAAGRLSKWMLDDTVFLASSDLTHFGGSFHYQPFPVDSGTGERLRELDYEVLEAASSLQEELFLSTLRETSSTVCGYQPISLLLSALRLRQEDEEIFQEVLDYQTSGEITGDFHHSVSYGAIGYFPYSSFHLPEKEQLMLLQLARRTLADFQQTGRRQAGPAGETAETLERRAGVFVTLRKEGTLRGCLGRVSPAEPLKELVPELTLAAALDDSRFDPVSPSESGIDVEVSLLSPMKRVSEKGEFLLNVHGALLKAEGRQGLLLPQVAEGRGWDAGQFFETLARKAGVTSDAYGDPSTRLYVFRAQMIQ